MTLFEFIRNDTVVLVVRYIPLTILTIMGIYSLIKCLRQYFVLKDSVNFEDTGTKVFKVKKLSKGFNSITYTLVSEDKKHVTEIIDVDKWTKIKKGDTYGELHIWANPKNENNYLVMGKEEKFKKYDKQAWAMIVLGCIEFIVCVVVGFLLTKLF